MRQCALWARGFGGSARAVGAGRGCGDGASAGCVIVVAAFEAPAVVTGLDDVTVVGQAVEQRGRHLGIAKHTGPLSECEIGGDDDRRALVEPADEVEQELAAGLSERKVAKFVKLRRRCCAVRPAQLAASRDPHPEYASRICEQRTL